MPFSTDAWTATAAIRQAIHDLPFNRELAAGTLRADRFKEYMLQDALYLAAYARVLAAAAAKAPDAAAQEFLAEASKVALIVERALHESYLTQFGISRAEAEAAEPSPTCLAYTSYLLATAQTGSYETLMAAILPCFWIYRDVGLAIAKVSAPGNPYQAWVDTYSDEGFGRSVATAIALTDAAATGLDARRTAEMHLAFKRCCQYEWMFWDAAYRLERWPV